MALIVFLRGVNVGGHRTFRPSILAREPSDYEVVNVGAAGTFVVRKPGSRARFRAALLLKLPFEAEVVVCEGRDLMRMEMKNPFGPEPCPSNVVRFDLFSACGQARDAPPHERRPRVDSERLCKGVCRLPAGPRASGSECVGRIDYPAQTV